MSKRWATIVSVLALMVAFGTAAEANICPDAGGTQFIVDQAADLPFIQAGYNNQACDLIVNIGFTPTVQGLVVRAKTITIEGADPLNPIQIIKATAGSTQFWTAFGGDLTIKNADIRATAEMRFTCIPATCFLDVKTSTIIVSVDTLFGSPNGTLEFQSGAGTDIQTSTIYAGALLIVKSQQGFVTFICAPGQGGCKDPTVGAPPPIIANQCGNPIVFPCNAAFQNAGELREVCIQAPGVQCGGASKQLDLIAATDVHIENSTILGQGIFNIDAKTGQIFAAGAVLTGKVFDITAGNVAQLSPAIDLTDAKVTAVGNIRIFAKPGGCPALLTDICVEARRAELIAKKGSSFFKVNNDSAPPLDKNTDDQAAECAVLGLGPVIHDKGDGFINADNATGRVVVCEALLN